MSNQDEKLIWLEYENAKELTYHVDNQRISLTKFSMSIIGVLLALIFALYKEDQTNISSIVVKYMGIIVYVFWFINVLVVAILARLRKAQLESFRIIAKIREYCLGKNYNLWNIVQLSRHTLPKGTSINSGTYFWLLLVILINSLLLPLGYALTRTKLSEISNSSITFLFFGSVIFMNAVYFLLGNISKELIYSVHFDPSHETD